MPLADFEEKLADLPSDSEVVVYCRGHYSILSDNAVTKLLAHGYKARRMEKGLPEWKAQGLPVEHGFPL
jgi:ArsR family transcriptional regulator